MAVGAAALIPIGICIGILLGSVGGGGSLIAVPALVYIGGESVHSAQASALVVVVVTSGIGLATYLHRDRVRWRAGLAFGVAAGASSFAGSVLSRHLDPDVLLLAFSPVMVAGAAAMLSDCGSGESRFRPWRHGVTRSAVVKVSLLGLAVGWITGLFGVGGGFVVVPVLVLALGFGLTEAVGTSLLIIVVGSVVALATRLHGGGVEWDATLPFVAAAVAGVIVGVSIAERLSTVVLTRWFAVVVLLTAVYTATKSTLALG